LRDALIVEAFEVKTLSRRMMDENPSQNGDFASADALEAAFDWWREAGVDLD